MINDEMTRKLESAVLELCRKNDRIRDLEEQNARLREVLEWYADDRNIMPSGCHAWNARDIWDDDLEVYISRCDRLDKGEKARRALASCAERSQNADELHTGNGAIGGGG